MFLVLWATTSAATGLYGESSINHMLTSRVAVCLLNLQNRQGHSSNSYSRWWNAIEHILIYKFCLYFIVYILYLLNNICIYSHCNRIGAIQCSSHFCSLIQFSVPFLENICGCYPSRTFQNFLLAFLGIYIYWKDSVFFYKIEKYVYCS